MDMVGCNDVVEDSKSITILRRKQPIKPSFPVFRKLKEKFLFMATMRDMPDLSWNMMPIGSSHPGIP